MIIVFQIYMQCWDLLSNRWLGKLKHMLGLLQKYLDKKGWGVGNLGLIET